MISRFYKGFLIILSLPVLLSEYFKKETGREYKIGLFKKVSLVLKMIWNNLRITSASSFLEHLVMATTIFKIPKSLEGTVVECGSYKGGSTANLSLACALTGRILEVFDSFKGLPEPKATDAAHTISASKELHTYSQGAFSGTLEEVKNNISKYGKIEACRFNVGFFDDTLPKFKNKVAFVFEDVDLRESLEICLWNLWPLMQEGCYFYTHEAAHLEISSLFFDKDWWQKNMKQEPPGLIGAGTGLGLVPAANSFKSALGYSIKNIRSLSFKEVVQEGKAS